jgi:hypothetical protein
MNIELIEENDKENVVASIDGEIIKNIPSPESRIIFKIKNMIIKFDARYWRGYSDSQCLTEVKMWNEVIEEQDKKYFQPIIDSGINWIAQELIEFSPLPFNRDAWKIIQAIAKKYHLVDIDPTKNWGMRLDGTPVIYDYGV